MSVVVFRHTPVVEHLHHCTRGCLVKREVLTGTGYGTCAVLPFYLSHVGTAFKQFKACKLIMKAAKCVSSKVKELWYRVSWFWLLSKLKAKNGLKEENCKNTQVLKCTRSWWWMWSNVSLPDIYDQYPYAWSYHPVNFFLLLNFT